MIEFKLPSLGAEMDEGTLLEWRVGPGDVVHKGDVVAVVDTSKSAIDVEIWQDGTIDALRTGLNEKVPVGTVLAWLREPGETPEHVEAERRRLAASAAAAPSAAAPVPGVASGAPPAPAKAPADVSSNDAVAARSAAGERRHVSPAARVRAEALGVDLARVPGTGPDAAVTVEDVERVAAARRSPADRALAMRAAIGAAMARSKRDIPHYYLATDTVLARAIDWLTARNAARPVTGRVVMAAVLLKAVAIALRSFPDLNGYYRDGAFVAGAGIHLGVAISLRQGGLIAPAIRDTDTLTLDELMKRLADLVARARALTLKSSEMSDATVTVTNLGDQGVDLVEGVIYPPQVALVGFGRVRQRPWLDGQTIVPAPVVTVTLSADHRASDGHRGGLFLNHLDALLQDPARLDEATR